MTMTGFLIYSPDIRYGESVLCKNEARLWLLQDRERGRFPVPPRCSPPKQQMSRSSAPRPTALDAGSNEGPTVRISRVANGLAVARWLELELQARGVAVEG